MIVELEGGFLLLEAARLTLPPLNSALLTSAARLSEAADVGTGIPRSKNTANWIVANRAFGSASGVGELTELIR